MFPFVPLYSASLAADTNDIQQGSNSLTWVKVPFESPNRAELIYVRMTREQFAGFEKAGIAAVQLMSGNGAQGRLRTTPHLSEQHQ